METYLVDTIVIVGAGHAGGRVALSLRDAGWSGPVLLIGEERDPPYERPPLSKGVLLGEAFAGTLAPAERYAAAGIEWLGDRRVTAIDRVGKQVLLDDGRRVAYHRLLLATGGQARTLALPGAGLDGVLTLRTLGDAQVLAQRLAARARLAVIGGGFIGLEVAASARALGCEVHLLEAAPRLLGRTVPVALAQRVQALHEARGVKMHVGVAPERFERTDSGLSVHLADGTVVDVDTILVGIGIAPAVELAERAGLPCANGIVVDAGLRTADASIFAAGDVAAFPSALSGQTRRLESWHNAEDHARVAAVNLVGGSATVGAAPWFWSDQYDHQLQIAGDPSLGVTCITRPLADGAQIDFHLGDEGRIVGVAGFGPTSALAKEFKLGRMLFERDRRPGVASLADAAVKLKSLL